MNKKLIVITGAASGVGRELALKLISKGNTIVGIDLNENELKSLHTKYKDQFIVYTQDLTQIQDYTTFLNKIQESWGKVDYWFNNAGIVHVGDFDKISDQQFDQVMKINFEVMAKFCQHLVPIMEQNGSGVIVNISSVAGHAPCPYVSSYTASKFAISGYTQTLQLELDFRKSPVKLILASPGFFESNLHDGSSFGKLKSLLDKVSSTAEKVAKEIIKGVENLEPFICPTFHGKALMKINKFAPGLNKLFGKVVLSKK